MKLKTDQRGFILVITLLFLSVLSLMVFSDMETAVLEAKMVGKQRLHHKLPCQTAAC